MASSAQGTANSPSGRDGRYSSAVANVAGQTGLAHTGMERVAPSALLVITAVPVGLALIETLIEILAESGRGVRIRPLAPRALVYERDDRAAYGIEFHQEELVLQPALLGLVDP